jgi:hypothetical protein
MHHRYRSPHAGMVGKTVCLVREVESEGVRYAAGERFTVVQAYRGFTLRHATRATGQECPPLLRQVSYDAVREAAR